MTHPHVCWAFFFHFHFQEKIASRKFKYIFFEGHFLFLLTACIVINYILNSCMFFLEIGIYILLLSMFFFFGGGGAKKSVILTKN